MKRAGIALLGIFFSLAISCSTSDKNVNSVRNVLKDDVLKMAKQNLNEEPITVTAYKAERSEGGIHDFYSEGDYWWPDPENPDGPYIRLDGKTNPDNFVEHRHAMIRFSQIVGNLTSAYLINHDHCYVDAVLKHVRAWFVDDSTKMNPSLLYAQAIKGRASGRGVGIIDTIHLMEVAQSLYRLEASGVIPEEDLKATKQWFSDYLSWLKTHQYGVNEMDAKNNHGTCWVMQAAAFARYIGDAEMLDFCRRRYKEILLPNQMAVDGSFPQELRRTKPYGYSLFNLDAMATICQILSDKNDDLWTYTADGVKNIQRGIEFLYPYVKDKNTWPYNKDVMYWDQWPVAQPFLVFGGIRFDNNDWLNTWSALNHFPDNEEVIRNLPVRNPLIWL